MILEVDPNFDKTSLTEDHYLTLQYDVHIKYWLTRLLKASLPWKSVGVTHEYWDIDRSKVGANYNTRVARLETLVVNDPEMAGAKLINLKEMRGCCYRNKRPRNNARFAYKIFILFSSDLFSFKSI